MNKTDTPIKIVQKPIPLKDNSNANNIHIDKSMQMIHETLTLLQKEVNDLRQRVYALEPH